MVSHIFGQNLSKLLIGNQLSMKQMAEAKKNERSNALKEVKRLCKEFGFTAGMLKGSLAEGRKKQ